MENIVLMCHVSHSFSIDAKLKQAHVGKKGKAFASKLAQASQPVNREILWIFHLNELH